MTGALIAVSLGQLGQTVAEHCPTCGHTRTTSLWLMIGFLGQAVFTARFLAQWIASEKRRDSVVPVIFWWLSLGGGMLLLAYAISRHDPVITVGQSMGVFIYVRNLMLVSKKRAREAKRQAIAQQRPLIRADAAVRT
jgi:lipid-A-disaccharide synthase-like uncharacterized protein